jgi:hypothetical protein
MKQDSHLPEVREAKADMSSGPGPKVGGGIAQGKLKDRRYRRCGGKVGTFPNAWV